MSVSIAGNGTLTGVDPVASGFGKVVAVKSALLTSTQSNSTAAGGNFAVTNLSITHSLSDASNNLVLIAYIGANGHSATTRGAAFAFASDGNLIGVGDSAGNRRPVASGVQGVANALAGTAGVPQAIALVTSPGDTSSHTYTVRGVNVDGNTATVYVNRTSGDYDGGATPRSSSSFILMEVAG